MQTVAEVLAETLKDAGIETVFGLPGGENVHVLDALRTQDIEFVLVRNESSAVYMADATARLTGKPGVCLTTLGPGAANAYAGVAHAWLDRAPVLVITAQSIERLLGHHTHQVLDLQAVFAPVTKQTCTLTTIDTRQTVEDALRLTMSGRPGPVHLGISSEMATQPVDQETTNTTSVSPSDTEPTFTDWEKARQLLSHAQRPVIVTGLGLEPEQPYSALQELAEAANAPVVGCPKGKGALPDDHPLAAGTIGLTRIDPPYEILDEADCIIAVGFDVVELVKPWDQAAPLIWVAPWANEDPTLAAEAEFAGPMTPVLQQLVDSQFATAPDWGATRVAALRNKLARQSLPAPQTGTMRPQAVLQSIRANTPCQTLVTTDVGSHKILTGLTWPAYVPNRYMVSNGLSAMGFSVPAAAAAAKVLNEPVVSINGDAGLGMVLGELNMLTQLNVPVIIVVMNDNALDLIRSAQVRAEKSVYGTEFTNPNFVQIANANGMEAHRVTNEDECADAIQKAVAARRPILIEAMIDPASYPTTPGFVYPT